MVIKKKTKIKDSFNRERDLILKMRCFSPVSAAVKYDTFNVKLVIQNSLLAYVRTNLSKLNAI